MKIRPAAVSGQFYPGSAAALRAELGELFAPAGAPEAGPPPRGLVVPHAGYVFSGQVAAQTFAQVKGLPYGSVVVISPSHAEAFSFSSVFDGDAYRTPLGDAAVNYALAEALAEADPAAIRRSERGHAAARLGRAEHALEVQIPFLQTVLPAAKLVPVVMGSQSPSACRALGAALARTCRGQDVLLVASSDLSHFHPLKEAQRLDNRFLELLKKADAEALLKAVEEESCEACGAGPVAAVLIACAALGARTVRLTRYATSADSPHGDAESVVGYGGAVIC